MPKWCVVTPCFNAEAFIAQTVASVQNQTETDLCHIVINDESRDNSGSVVEGLLADDTRLHLINQKNRGCAGSRNAGFRAALSIAPDCRYLWFLDADDLLLPHALQTVGAYLDAHPTVGMTHSCFNFVDDKGDLVSPEAAPMQWAKRWVPTKWGMRPLRDDEPETPFPSVFVLAGIIPSLAAFRRNVYETTNGWDEDLGLIYEDVSLYLEMALRAPVHYLPQKLADYRLHAHQVSTKADRFFHQELKLYAKWYAKTGLPPDQQEKLEAAKRFRDRRFLAHKGASAGINHLRQGQIAPAVRFLGGAARRYAAGSATL